MVITITMIGQEIKIIEEIGATKNKTMMAGEEKGQDHHQINDKGIDTTKAIKEEEVTQDKWKEDKDSLIPTQKEMFNNCSKD